MTALSPPKCHELTLEKVTIESAADVQAIIDCAPTFLKNVEGLSVDSEYASRDLQALPPGCALDQKYFFVIKNGADQIGVADLVKDYPKKGTAFLGLLLLAEKVQRNGFGTKAYRLLEEFALSKLSADKIRLAYNDSNPVAQFWQKMGFSHTGESKPYKGRTRDSAVILMEKELT